MQWQKHGNDVLFPSASTLPRPGHLRIVLPPAVSLPGDSSWLATNPARIGALGGSAPHGHLVEALLLFVSRFLNFSKTKITALFSLFGSTNNDSKKCNYTIKEVHTSLCLVCKGSVKRPTSSQSPCTVADPGTNDLIVAAVPGGRPRLGTPQRSSYPTAAGCQDEKYKTPVLAVRTSDTCKAVQSMAIGSTHILYMQYNFLMSTVQIHLGNSGYIGEAWSLGVQELFSTCFRKIWVAEKSSFRNTESSVTNSGEFDNFLSKRSQLVKKKFIRVR